MTKNELRQLLMGQRNELSTEDQKRYSNKISNRLFQTDIYQFCKMLFVYVSFRSEVETKEIILRALSDGKKVFLPRVIGKRMEFFEVKDLNGLQVSDYGIEEPVSDESTRFNGFTTETDSKDHLMLLPGLAFDYTGNRIGYGAGFYDRYLSSHSDFLFYKIGLLYDFQLLDHIEADIHDKKADAVLTPTKLILCER